jgi:hypothetical protein
MSRYRVVFAARRQQEIVDALYTESAQFAHLVHDGRLGGNSMGILDIAQDAGASVAWGRRCAPARS